MPIAKTFVSVKEVGIQCSLTFIQSLICGSMFIVHHKNTRVTYNLCNKFTTQPVFTCSKLTMKTQEQSVKYTVTMKTPEQRH